MNVINFWTPETRTKSVFYKPVQTVKTILNSLTF